MDEKEPTLDPDFYFSLWLEDRFDACRALGEPNPFYQEDKEAKFNAKLTEYNERKKKNRNRR